MTGLGEDTFIIAIVNFPLPEIGILRNGFVGNAKQQQHDWLVNQ